MSTCNCHATHGYCQCMLADTNCLTVTGVDPYMVGVRLNPASTNIFRVTPSGLSAIQPTLIRYPPNASAGAGENLVVTGGNLIPFTVTRSDSDAILTGGRAVIRTSGMYVCTVSVRWRDSHSAIFGIRKIYGLGGYVFTFIPANPPRTSEVYQTMTLLVRFSEGDLIQIFADVDFSAVELQTGSSEIASGNLGLCRIASTS